MSHTNASLFIIFNPLVLDSNDWKFFFLLKDLAILFRFRDNRRVVDSFLPFSLPLSLSPSLPLTLCYSPSPSLSLSSRRKYRDFYHVIILERSFKPSILLDIAIREATLNIKGSIFIKCNFIRKKIKNSFDFFRGREKRRVSILYLGMPGKLG